MLRVGELEIDRVGMEVRVDGGTVALTPTEYRLLLELAEHCGIVCSRERLLETVWGYVWAGDTRLVDMHVRRLRAKVGATRSRPYAARVQAGEAMSSLRWRLALAFALLAAAVAAAVGVVVYELTADDLLSRARAAAVAQAQAAALIYPLTRPALPSSVLPAGDPSVPAGCGGGGGGRWRPTAAAGTAGPRSGPGAARPTGATSSTYALLRRPEAGAVGPAPNADRGGRGEPRSGPCWGCCWPAGCRFGYAARQ